MAFCDTKINNGHIILYLLSYFDMFRVPFFTRDRIYAIARITCCRNSVCLSNGGIIEQEKLCYSKDDRSMRAI